jgi:cation-transporting ATPase 13A3/4/5
MTKPKESPIHLKNSGFVVQVATWLEKKLQWMIQSERVQELCEVVTTESNIKYIVFHCVRYILNTTTQEFERQSLNVDIDNLDYMGIGLEENEANRRLNLIGRNELAFKAETLWQGLLSEFSGPFYLYQLMILLTWYFYAYYYMGIVLTVVIIISGVTKVIVSSFAQQRVLDMIRFNGEVNVMRNGRWRVIDIHELVPGDIFELKLTQQILSVDCVILNGDVVMDESSLTGEALPVGKFAWDFSNTYSKENAKMSTLYAGTNILEVQAGESNEKCIGVVTETGSMTERGKLVREILYPIPFVFTFHEHLKLVIPLLFLWGIVMLIVSILMLESETVDSWFYGMFSISQILSPLLPTVFVIGQSISAERLRAQGIMCMDLNRITLSGKVKIFCFDKTGTLTKEGLEFLGVQCVGPDTLLLSLTRSFENFPTIVKALMMSCHTLTTVNGKYVGNFVDTEMFKATRAVIVPTNNAFISDHNAKPMFKIIKRFQFVHSHSYMTVIAEDLETNERFVFIKGSYERILEKVRPHSIPVDFVTQALYHASKGCYVIAIAGKSLTDEFQGRSRDELEKDLDLLGILLFRNELKSDTREVLKELKDGGCNTIMITGDHPLTASYIGSQCFMVENLGDKDLGFLFLVDTVDDRLEWKELNTNTIWTQSRVEAACHFSQKGGKKVELIITGNAFRALNHTGWVEKYLSYIRIFARMRPLDKVEAVKRYMAENITAMIGDGGNDSGALKTAHVGVSLSSSAESSVVSHFSYKHTSLVCCVQLLKESRCSLDVSIAAYK